MNEGHQLGEKGGITWPASQDWSVCSHDVFTADVQLIARARHLLKILESSKANLQIGVNKFWDHLMKRNRHKKKKHNPCLSFLVIVFCSRRQISLAFSDENTLKLFTNDSTKERLLRAWHYAEVILLPASTW